MDGDCMYRTYECALCIEMVKDPRALQCGHIFCFGCLQHADRSKPLHLSDCPVCKKKLSVPLPATPPVHAVRNHLKDYENTCQSPSDTLPPCSADHFGRRFVCETCGVCMCETCWVSEHTGHKVIPYLKRKQTDLGELMDAFESGLSHPRYSARETHLDNCLHVVNQLRSHFLHERRSLSRISSKHRQLKSCSWSELLALRTGRHTAYKETGAVRELRDAVSELQSSVPELWEKSRRENTLIDSVSAFLAEPRLLTCTARDVSKWRDGDRISSSKVAINDIYWRVLIRPKRSSNCRSARPTVDNVGIFVKARPSSRISGSVRVNARFTVTIIRRAADPSDQSPPPSPPGISRSAVHVFSAESWNIGWPEFIPMADLLDPANAYVATSDDSVRVECSLVLLSRSSECHTPDSSLSSDPGVSDVSDCSVLSD